MKRIVTLLACMFFFAVAGTLTAQDNLEFFVNAPASLAGQYVVGPPAEGFGGNLAPGESITGDLAVAMDTSSDMTLAQQACFPLVNGGEVAGKIALIRRGSCFFSDKVWNAQEAGAIGVIICNNAPGVDPITMGAGGDFAGLATIPSGMVTFELCEQIFTELANGGTVTITMNVPAFFGAIASYSYHTPESQIIPIDILQATLVNPTADDANDVTVQVDITDPDGNLTSLSETLGVLPAGADSVVTMTESYTPTVQGEYSVIFSNTLTSDILETSFVITNDIFAPDNAVVTGDAGPSFEQFSLNDIFKYHVGSLALVGEEGAVATHVSFAIANAADVVASNDAAFHSLSIILYDGDEDGDNTLNWQAGAAGAFDNLAAVGLGNYTMTGNETADDMIMVDLLDISTGSLTVPMKPDGAYYASVQYDGDAALATVAPSFVSTENVDYLNFPTTPIFIDQLYTGWAGTIVICRLHIDATVNVEDITILDESKINITPNPASDFVNLSLDFADLADEVKVDIINYQGQVVETRILKNVKNDTFTFDVSDFASGYYFFSVKSPEGYMNKAISIAR